MRLDAFWKPKQEILDAVAAAHKTAKKGRMDPGPRVEPGGLDARRLSRRKRTSTRSPRTSRSTSGAPTATRPGSTPRPSRLAGSPKSTPNPQGGEIIHDANGDATGVLIDTARALVSKNIPPLSKDRVLESLMRGPGRAGLQRADRRSRRRLRSRDDRHDEGALRIGQAVRPPERAAADSRRQHGAARGVSTRGASRSASTTTTSRFVASRYRSTAPSGPAAP